MKDHCPIPHASTHDPLGLQKELPGDEPVLSELLPKGGMNLSLIYINGQNDNHMIGRRAPPYLIQQSKAVVAMFGINQLVLGDDGMYKAISHSNNPLCLWERFAGEPMLSHFTGFMIGSENILATAAHPFSDVEEMYAVFGYRMDGGVARTSFSAAEVHRISRKKTIEPPEGKKGADWMLFQLDREIPRDVVPLTLARRELRVKEPLYVIHHPLGLPMKYADNAKVLELNGEVFLSSLDAMKGSSGAPVFSRETHDVVGIVKNGVDYSLDKCGSCSVFHLTPPKEAMDVLSTSVEAFARFIL